MFTEPISFVVKAMAFHSRATVGVVGESEWESESIKTWATAYGTRAGPSPLHSLLS